MNMAARGAFIGVRPRGKWADGQSKNYKAIYQGSNHLWELRKLAKHSWCAQLYLHIIQNSLQPLCGLSHSDNWTLERSVIPGDPDHCECVCYRVHTQEKEMTGFKACFIPSQTIRSPLQCMCLEVGWSEDKYHSFISYDELHIHIIATVHMLWVVIYQLFIRCTLPVLACDNKVLSIANKESAKFCFENVKLDFVKCGVSTQLGCAQPIVLYSDL